MFTAPRRAMRRSPGGRWSSPGRALPIALLAALLVVSGCSGSTDKPTSAKPGRLSVQFIGAPVSLNPALASSGRSAMYAALAYDPLIYLAGDGKLVPDLATEWKYLDSENKLFELTLREGVKFADGTVMTAEHVKASMVYFLGAGGGLVSQVGQIEKVDAPDARTIRITYKTANPNAAMTLTQYYGIGLIIGPSGLKDPQALLTSSHGTGAYLYDSGSSVTGNRYDYLRNPHYWNPKAQVYDGVSVKVIGDPNAVLSSITTGQIDFAGGNPATAESAERSGLKIMTAPFYNWSLMLADRAGTVSKPLADQRVRQAIAYALDRKALAQALGGRFAEPSTQVLLPGTDGYIEGFGYSHDLSKAQQLMRDAGYPNGFELTVLTQSIIDPNTRNSQAIANALGAIGIKVQLQVVSTGVAQFNTEALTKKYAALIYPTAGVDMSQASNQIFATKGLFNPFGSTDAQVQDILSRAFRTSGKERTDLYQQANRRFAELAWVVPIIAVPNIYYVGKNVTGITTSVINPNPIPTAPDPNLAWRPAQQ